ncbi:MAG TPA: hypothetical protein VII49_12640 [Rhizomicrobium sp.]
MHDWILKSVLFEWKLARVIFIFDNLQAIEAKLIAADVVDLHITQRKEWGPSVSVNNLIGPSDLEGGVRKLIIEMQSGDVITIIASAFDIPAK